MVTLADNVRVQIQDAHERDGVSVAELARRLGATRSYVYQLLDGSRGNLTLAQLERVATALKRRAVVRLAGRR